MVSPLLFVQRVIEGMQHRRFGRIVPKTQIGGGDAARGLDRRRFGDQQARRGALGGGHAAGATADGRRHAATTAPPLRAYAHNR